MLNLGQINKNCCDKYRHDDKPKRLDIISESLEVGLTCKAVDVIFYILM